MFKQLKEKFGRLKKPAKKPPKTLCYEELEERVLFSADVMAGLDGIAFDEQVLVEDVSSDVQFAREAAPARVEQAVVQAPRELIFVDAGLPNYQQLVDDVLAKRNDDHKIEVVMLDTDSNGVEQISEVLAERRDLDAVHFVSHGTDRAVKLGNTWLQGDNLDAYAEDIADWKQSLSNGADLLFYGCELASGADGRALLDAFGSLTGADVSASDDLTGHSSLGGD